jgi:hypothetical protein
VAVGEGVAVGVSFKQVPRRPLFGVGAGVMLQSARMEFLSVLSMWAFCPHRSPLRLHRSRRSVLRSFLPAFQPGVGGRGCWA